jgi:transposase InsO family protein
MIRAAISRTCSGFSRLTRKTRDEFDRECLNVNQFLSIEDARSKIEAWRMDYNHLRPHSSHGQRSPAEHLERATTGMTALRFFQQ